VHSWARGLRRRRIALQEMTSPEMASQKMTSQGLRGLRGRVRGTGFGIRRRCRRRRRSRHHSSVVVHSFMFLSLLNAKIRGEKK